MKLEQEIGLVAKQLSLLAVKQRFAEFEPIMQNIFCRDEKLSFLAGLANELSGAFSKLCLVGLDYIITLHETDYTKLFELAHGKDIAMYNLTDLMLTHGGATQNILRRFCKDYDEVKKIKQFQQRIDRGSPSSEETEANRRLYNYLNVSAEKIKTFREKIAAMT